MSISQIVRTRGKAYRVKRPVYKVDSVGTRKKTFVNMHRVNAYVASKSSNEGWENDRQVQVDNVTLYLAGNADLKIQDRLVIEDVDYEITGIRTPGHKVAGDRLHYQIVSAQSNRSL